MSALEEISKLPGYNDDGTIVVPTEEQKADALKYATEVGGMPPLALWSMPHFTPNPIPQQDLLNFTSFNMTNFCCNGLLHGNGTAFDMIPNEEQNSLKVAADMKATNPHAHVSPYIGFEMGQSWFKAQVRVRSIFVIMPPIPHHLGRSIACRRIST